MAMEASMASLRPFSSAMEVSLMADAALSASSLVSCLMLRTGGGGRGGQQGGRRGVWGQRTRARTGAAGQEWAADGGAQRGRQHS